MRMWAYRSIAPNGFSLVELLVAMTIGLMMLGALLSIYIATSMAVRQSDTVTRMAEDASIALETLARHIRMAGYSKLMLMAPRNSAPVDGQVAQTADSNLAGAGLRGCDGGFASTTVTWSALACSNISTQPDAIAIRYEGDSFNTEAAGGNDASDCLSQGVAPNTNSAVDSSLQFALVEARFFINANKDLSCAGNGNARFQSQPLVRGVEFMRLRYGIASDMTESQVIRYVTAAQVDALAGDADQKWGRVVAVRICIQMVSPTADQGKAAPFINCDGILTHPADKYVHHPFTTTVSLRNRAGITP